MGKQVLCFGEVLWDTFEDGKKAGGAPMNVAMHLVQQGVEVAFASRIGEDPSGDELVDPWIARSLLGQAAQIGRVFKIAEEVSGLSACFRRAYADPIKRTSTLEPVGYGKRRPC